MSQSRRTFLKLSGAVLGGIATGTTVTAAEVTDRFIVDTRGVRGNALQRSDLTVVHDLSEVDLAVVEGSESAVEEIASDYGTDVEVELDLPDATDAVPDHVTEAEDEPYYSLQWDKQAMNVPDAHHVSRGGGARVTIIDTGIDADHPDLAANVNESLSQDFTGDGYGPGPYGGAHGSHVAGIVAADADNDAGITGTAPEAELVDCRVFSQEPGASFADILAAVVYSASIDADVANLSLGAYPVPRQGLGQFYGKVLNRTMTYVNSQGTLIVVAAGNDSADLQHDGNVISLPNEGAQGFSVAATGPIGFGWDADGDEADDEFEDLQSPPESPAFYTNYGTNAIDVAAPGGDADLEAIDTGVPWYYDLVLSTVPMYDEEGDYTGGHTASYNWFAGTSMAAPNAAGVAALVRSVDSSLNANQVDSIVRQTASVPDGYDRAYYGSGFVDAAAAVQAASGNGNGRGNGNGNGRGN